MRSIKIILIATAASLLLSSVVSAQSIPTDEYDTLLVPGTLLQNGSVYTATVESETTTYQYVIDTATGTASWATGDSSGSITIPAHARGQSGYVLHKGDGDSEPQWLLVPLVGVAMCLVNHQAQIQSFMKQCFDAGGTPDVDNSGYCGYGASFVCRMPCAGSGGASGGGENCDQTGSM